MDRIFPDMIALSINIFTKLDTPLDKNINFAQR